MGSAAEAAPPALCHAPPGGGNGRGARGWRERRRRQVRDRAGIGTGPEPRPHGTGTATGRRQRRCHTGTAPRTLPPVRDRCVRSSWPPLSYRAPLSPSGTGVDKMAAPEKDPDLRLLQKNPLDPSSCQKSQFLESEWKAAMVSLRSLSRCPSVAESRDGGIGTSCSDSTEGEGCVTLTVSLSLVIVSPQGFNGPKATLVRAIALLWDRLCRGVLQELEVAELWDGQSRIAGSVFRPPAGPGLARSGELSAGKASQVPPRELLRLCRASGDGGCEHAWPPAAERTRTEGACKFDTPAMEQTLNQSLLMDSLCTEPLHRCQQFSPSSEAGKDHYKVLPESKQAPGANGTREPRGAPWPSGSRVVPAGLQANSFYSKPVAAPPGRAWLQEGCTLHSHQGICELSAWKQQLDKVQLQVEQMQVSFDTLRVQSSPGLCYSLLHLPDQELKCPLQNGGTCPHSSLCSPSLPAPDPAQWINILNSNENLLKEKELLIDRQRQHISQLEQKVRESELQVHSALLGCPASYGDLYMLRMQELQRENTFLRAQFTEKTESLSKENIELERKLAAAELDVKRGRESLKETVQKHAEELKKQEERVKGRDKHINNLKKKCQKESEQNRERQQRIETLERYLADLPTLEDHQKQSQKLKESELKTTALQETVLTLETELGDVQAAFREQELQLETQRHKERELLSTVHSLQDKLQQYAKNAERGAPGQDGERQKMEHDSLKKECDCLRKCTPKSICD
ncbi:centrosomal protein of 85 kDa-like [Ammospiza maritima maritima]